jgi:transcription antitermination protein NusB
MGRRREGREAAVQYLFAHEIQPAADAAGDDAFWSLHMAKKGARAYAEDLVKGVLAHLTEIDRCIESAVENYRMERLAAVERNILRVAVYELNHVSDAPPPVVINEAIEIAKKFGATESGGFVNGILDRIAKNNKAAATSAAPPTTDHLLAKAATPADTEN